jgi:hypothetical protein
LEGLKLTKSLGELKMESPTILFFMGCFVVLFLIVGIIAGWFINDIVYNFYNKNSPQLHPEMYDDQGIVINEELLAVTFIDEEEEEEEDDYY